MGRLVFRAFLRGGFAAFPQLHPSTFALPKSSARSAVHAASLESGSAPRPTGHPPARRAHRQSDRQSSLLQRLPCLASAETCQEWYDGLGRSLTSVADASTPEGR